METMVRAILLARLPVLSLSVMTAQFSASTRSILSHGGGVKYSLRKFASQMIPPALDLSQHKFAKDMSSFDLVSLLQARSKHQQYIV